MLITTPPKICEYVGEAEHRFMTMVRKEQLPAWQSGPRRVWKAKAEDLDAWIDRQRLRHLKRDAIKVIEQEEKTS